ncbi:MAG TPA: hypothetical protein PKK15_06970 [Kouleothrix sp.]|nr:hypothetical protein [Kouleothrix sp.]
MLAPYITTPQPQRPLEPLALALVGRRSAQTVIISGQEFSLLELYQQLEHADDRGRRYQIDMRLRMHSALIYRACSGQAQLTPPPSGLYLPGIAYRALLPSES